MAAARDDANSRAPLAAPGVLAAALFAGGFFAPLLGIGFFVIHSLLREDGFFSGLGSALVFVSIPLLLAGSHCLDRADAKRRAPRPPATDERADGGRGEKGTSPNRGE